MAFQIVKLVDPLNPTIITGGLVPRGAYDNGTDYAVGDSVDYNGSSYVMYVNAGAGTLPTDTTKWQVVANKGLTGATGATGPPGSGGGGGQTWVVNEIPTPSPNGSVTVFTVAETYIATTLKVFLNGLRQLPGSGNDYTETSGTTFTFGTAPNSNATILVDYRTV